MVQGGRGDHRDWRRHYNDERPHSSLSGLTPSKLKTTRKPTPSKEAILQQSDYHCPAAAPKTWHVTLSTTVSGPWRKKDLCGALQQTIITFSGRAVDGTTTKGGNMLMAKDFFNTYFEALAAGGEDACNDYQGMREVWTQRATLALASAGRLMLPTGQVASKPKHDRYDRAEYLNLDVTLNDDDSWGPPVFIAEHENYPMDARVQYAAWKLLAVEAQRRMLVAYYGERTGIPSFDRLKELVLEVCNDNKNKDILLIGGEYNTQPKTIEELRKIHETAIVGKHD